MLHGHASPPYPRRSPPFILPRPGSRSRGSPLVARVAELVDAADSKSAALKSVSVRLRPRAPPQYPAPLRRPPRPELLAALRKLEARGEIETAHRTKQRASQIFRYAIATGRAEHDPAADLRGALTSLEVEHRAASTDPKRVGELLRAIDEYADHALKLAPCVFVRSGEPRAAEWPGFDFKSAE